MSLDELVVVIDVVDARVLALVGVVDGGAALAGGSSVRIVLVIIVTIFSNILILPTWKSC